MVLRKHIGHIVGLVWLAGLIGCSSEPPPPPQPVTPEVTLPQCVEIAHLPAPEAPPTSVAVPFIISYEGFRENPYEDESGHCTIGYGRLLKRGPCDGTESKTTKAIEWRRMTVFIGAIRYQVLDMVRVKLSMKELDALVSLGYNIGTGALRNSTLLKKLNAGDRQGAADQFLVWRKAGGKVNRGLEARRRKERALFLGKEEK